MEYPCIHGREDRPIKNITDVIVCVVKNISSLELPEFTKTAIKLEDKHTTHIFHLHHNKHGELVLNLKATVFEL